MIILTHSALSLWLSCINLHRLGWHKSQGDPVCRCMTHSQDGNYCKPPLVHHSCWWRTNFIQLSSESYVLPTYFYFCKWGLISRGDLFQMYLGCLLLYVIADCNQVSSIQAVVTILFCFPHAHPGHFLLFLKSVICVVSIRRSKNASWLQLRFALILHCMNKHSKLEI